MLMHVHLSLAYCIATALSSSTIYRTVWQAVCHTVRLQAPLCRIVRPMKTLIFQLFRSKFHEVLLARMWA